MNSPFGEVFMFLTDLAWKSRLTIPLLVTTAFLIMDIRLQIEINIQSGQTAAEVPQTDDEEQDDDEDEELDSDDELDEYTTESSDDEDENGNLYFEISNAISARG